MKTMKKSIILSFCIIVASQGYTQTDTSNVTVLSDTFCFSNQKPLLFTAKSKIFIDCDTVYVLNKHTMALYKTVSKALQQRTGLNTCTLVVSNLENRLDEQNKAFHKLYQNYIKLDSVSQQTIKDTKTSLVQVNNTLVKAQTDIVVVDKKMDDLKTTINKQRRQSFFDKIIYGTGGIAVGILAGLLITN